MGRKLGLKALGTGRSTPLICGMEAYPQMAIQARSNNRNHQVPPGYKYSFASEALYQTVLDLLLSPEALRSFKNDPHQFLDEREGLTTEERRKLLLEHHGVTRMMFKRDPQQEAVRFVGAALLDSQLAIGYRDYQEAMKYQFETGDISPAEYEGSISAWLLNQGYATTVSAITHAIKGVNV